MGITGKSFPEQSRSIIPVRKMGELNEATASLLVYLSVSEVLLKSKPPQPEPTSGRNSSIGA